MRTCENCAFTCKSEKCGRHEYSGIYVRDLEKKLNDYEIYNDNANREIRNLKNELKRIRK